MAIGKEAHGPDVFVILGMLKSLGNYSGDINGYYAKLRMEANSKRQMAVKRRMGK